ncbi:MAG: TPM domain-containing protein [Microscillaceae bacterium]|nr:TPM domain-containing protein [Microscillaceae bacterium]
MKNLLCLIICLMLCLICQAQIIPPKPKPAQYVNQFEVQILSPKEQQWLEETLRAYDDSTSTQIAVVIINSLKGHKIQEYAHLWAETWGIGQKEKDNGLLILIALKEKAVRIETGYGLEPIITDLKASDIINQIIIPAFKKEDYYIGISEAINEVFFLLRGEFERSEAEKNSHQNQKTEETSGKTDSSASSSSAKLFLAYNWLWFVLTNVLLVSLLANLKINQAFAKSLAISSFIFLFLVDFAGVGEEKFIYFFIYFMILLAASGGTGVFSASSTDTSSNTYSSLPGQTSQSNQASPTSSSSDNSSYSSGSSSSTAAPSSGSSSANSFGGGSFGGGGASGTWGGSAEKDSNNNFGGGNFGGGGASGTW